jgi:signal transduction histidine kinase
VKVEIIDRVRGIPQKEKAHLFSRFHQINPGTTGALKSSGLGLSIAKSLVEMHDGTFWFTLPLTLGVARFSES